MDVYVYLHYINLRQCVILLRFAEYCCAFFFQFLSASVQSVRPSRGTCQSLCGSEWSSEMQQFSKTSCRMKLLMNLMKPYIAHDETMHRMSPYPSISQQPMATNALRSVCASAYLRSRPRASRSSQISFGKKPFLSSGTTEKTLVVGLCGEIAL